MRHRVGTKHLNRDSNARKSLLKGLMTELFEHGQMTTSKTRAQEVKRLADKVIHKAQTDTIANRRLLHRVFGRRDIVNTLVERIAPLFSDRTSGFTRLTVVGLRRGDNSEQVTLSLVKQAEKVGDFKSGQVHEVIADKPKAKKVAAEKTPAATVVKTTKKVTTAKQTVTKK